LTVLAVFTFYFLSSIAVETLNPAQSINYRLSVFASLFTIAVCVLLLKGQLIYSISTTVQQYNSRWRLTLFLLC